MSIEVARPVIHKVERSIKSIMMEAWTLTNGAKGTFWWAFFLCGLCMIPIILVFVLIYILISLVGVNVTTTLVMDTVSATLSAPFAAAIWMVGIRYVSKQPSNNTKILGYFSLLRKFFIMSFWTTLLIVTSKMICERLISAWLELPPNTTLVSNLMANITHESILDYPSASVAIDYHQIIFFVMAAVITSIPVFIVSFMYLFSLPLIVDKKLTAWNALETSRKAIARNWLKIGAIYLVLMIISFLPILLFYVHVSIVVFLLDVLAYIWILPFALLVNSVLYRETFARPNSDEPSSEQSTNV